jgi:hypothetical protein
MKESGKNSTWFDGQLFRSEMEARWRLFYREMISARLFKSLAPIHSSGTHHQ